MKKIITDLCLVCKWRDKHSFSNSNKTAVIGRDELCSSFIHDKDATKTWGI